MNITFRSLLVIPGLLIGLANATPSLADPLQPFGVNYDGHNNWTVAPTGRSPDDAQHIQWVVDHATPGGKVQLGAGEFNFGDFDGVTIAKDLTIEGAWDKGKNTPLTTIKGGFMPLLIGRKTPIPKPEMISVNGRTVYHITQDLFGKFVSPFLYPPYYDAATGKQTGVHYDIFADWTAVDVNVRQITFERPYGSAIFTSGIKGGAIERCQFISVWPWQIDMEVDYPVGSAIMYMNMGAQPDIAAAYGVLSDPSLYSGTSLIRGNLVVQDNVIEGDLAEIAEGQTDANGRVIVMPYAGNPTPPGGDYANYVLQDVANDGIPFNLNPASPQPQYWVRKGYTAWSPDLAQVWARRGQVYPVYSLYSEATLTVQDNAIHNALKAIFFILNGAKGNPFNAAVERNTITANLQNETGVVSAQGVTVFEFPMYLPLTDSWITPNPGTNVAVKNNSIDQADPTAWFGELAIDVEVYGKASITDNTVKVNGGSGIGFWYPTQNGVIKNNRISGSGDYAFYALRGSNGNQFINNRVDQFTPTGMGASDTIGLGNPAAPAARGALFSDNNFVKGVGKVDPLDVVYDCGQNNVIQNMLAQACPSAAVVVAPQARAAITARPFANPKTAMGRRLTK